MDAPYKVDAGEPFEIEVTRLLPDGSTEPAVGVNVTQASEPTDAEGKTTAEVRSGFWSLIAQQADRRRRLEDGRGLR